MTKKISLFLMLLSIVASFFMFTGYATLSDELTINGTVSATPSEHTVNWLNYTAETNDENEEWEVIETDYPVLYGSTPQYNGDTPTRMATDQYTYTFTGWSTRTVDENGKESFTNVDISQYEVKADVDFYAVYNVVTNSYTVTWVNWDGTELEKDENIYNTNPTYDGATPTRPADAQYTYTFAGWEPTVSPVTGDVTYTAQYNATVNKYTITWNVDGVETSEEVEYGLIPTHENPEKTGYDFAGWQSSNGTVYAADSIPAVSGDETYTATWTPISYEIKYDLDGGSVTGNPTTYTIETATITLNNPTRKGYTFVGWTGTGLDSATKTVTIAKGSTGERSYTATWRANNYTIAFDGNGSTSGSTASVNATYDKDATLTANGFSKTGYTFIGWLAPDGAIYDDKATVKNLAASGTVTLIAQWDANEYTIKFNGKDSTSGSMSSISATYDKDVNLPANAYTKTGYTFDGWAENVFYGKSFVPTSEALNDIWYGPTSNWGYARLTDGSWNTNSTGRFSTKKLVSKDKENINTNEEDTSITFDATIDLAGTYRLSTMLIYCYNNDWRYAGSNFTVEFYNNGTKVKTLSYADLSQFVEGNYIKLELDDVEATSVKIYTSNAYANGLSISMLEIECYGSVVYEDRATVKNLTATNGGTVTLFAQLTPNKYTIEFNANGGSGTMNSITATYDQNAQLPANAFTRTGYTFKGWATSAGGNVAYANEAQLVKNLTATNGGTATLYAIWTPNTNTAYKVEHYKMNLDGTYPTTATETENKTGTTGASVTPAVKSYTGFTAPSTRTVTIAGNGSTVVKYYYERNNYTIKFVNEDGRELQLSSVPYDATPSYSGATPTKAATAQYTYTFKGWSPSIVSVTGEATYTATYSSTVNKYTIKFVNEDGTVLQSSSVAYGTTPVYSGATPTKAATAQYTYTFSGWSPEVSTVTGEATYTAQFSSTVNKYTVTWKNHDGSVLETDANVSYGSTPTYNGATPTKTGHTFTTWSPTIGTVKGNTVYTAQFTINQYTITFVTNGGSEVAAITQDYGTVVDEPQTTKTGYTFQRWCTDESLSATSKYTFTTMPAENITLYAKWLVNKYTIVFDKNAADASGTMDDIETDYNDPQTLPANEFIRTGYTFNGWLGSNGKTYTAGQSVTKLVTENNGTITLYAQWTINSYTITWVDGDGKTLKTDTIAYGETPVYSGSTPTKKATAKYTYTFKAWSPAITTVTGDATYTAQFDSTVNKYTITWETGDGKWSDDSTADKTTSVSYGVIPEAPETPTREGYTFNSWSPSIVSVTGEATYTATWTPITYSIKFYDNSSVATGTMKNQTMTYDKAQNLTANGFSRTGYTFAGWATSTTGNVVYTDQQSVNNLASTQGAVVELHAKWTPNSYSIKFDANGGSGSMSDIAMTYDTAKNLTANAFTKTGYTFSGWKDSSGNTYSDKQSVNNLVTTNNGTITLTAQWTANTYTIVFDANGGSGTMSNLGMTYDTAKNLTANAFTRTGYTFAGWATSAGGAVVYEDKASVNNLTTTANGTVNLYAQWTINQYTITCNPMGGEFSTGLTTNWTTIVNYNTVPNVPNNVDKPGYTFIGWSTSETGGEVITESNLPAATRDVTYYAQFTANNYTVIYNPNGGSLLGGPASITSNNLIPYPFTETTLTRNGITFTDNGDGTITVTGTVESGKTNAVFNIMGNGATISFPLGYYRIGSGVSTTLNAYFCTNNTTTGRDPGGIKIFEFTSANNLSGLKIRIGAGVTLPAAGLVFRPSLERISQHTYDTASNLSSNVFVREGYKFLGWSTNKDATTAQYTDGDEITKLAASGEVTLYAVWEKQCKVTWMSDDGNILRIDYIDKGTTPSYGVDPIKDAKVYEYYDANGNLKSAIGATYTFAGWDKTIGNVTSNVTYTARFTETKKQVTVTINYMTSNGVALNPQNVANPLNSNKPFNFPTTISVNIGEVTRIKSSNIPKLNSNGSVVVTDNKVNYQYYVVNENTDITAYTNTTITVYYTVGGGTGNNADTAYAGGDGLTPETAYEIAGVADFLYFRNQVNNGNNYKGYYFKLTKTINLTETTSSHMVGVRYDESGNPIYTEFQGTFDGQNHRITGLNIAGSEKDRYVGLFASVGQYGTVKNVITLSGSGAAIKSNYPAKPADYVETDEETYPYGAAGAIVGINKGIVDGCVNYINMTTGITCDYIGGVVGYSAYFGSNTEHSQVINCRNYGNITRTSESGAVGGVVGVAAGIVKGCYNSGTIEGKTSVGGIIGTVYHESIEISYNMNYGAVKVYSYNGGGIIGLSNAQTVHHNVNYGTITAENTATNIGGIIGGDTGNRVSILDASKNVIGRKIKYDAGSVSDNINYGTISGHHSAGGIVGVTESNLVNNINRGTIIGDYDIGGIAGKTYDINVTGCINYAQVTATGSLSVGNVLDACAGGIIGSAEQTKISNCTNNGAVTATEENVRAVAGIVGNVTTGTIGSSLNGTFTAAYIKNCINNGTITGSRFTAGIAGRLYDLNNTITVSYCINNGFIIASSWINGGLVGSMSHTNMTYSVNNGYVNSETSGSAGGLVGAVYSTSSVSHSQNHGTIRVLDNAAGLVHELDGRLENCDNTGTVIATNKGGKAVYFAAITSGGGTMSGCKNYAYSSTFTGNAFSGKTFTPTAEAEGDIYSSNFPYSKLTDGSDDNDTRRFSTLVDVNNSVVDATLSLGSATYVSQMTIKLYSESSKPAIEYAGRDFMVQVKVNGVWMTVIDCNTNDDISKYLSGDTLTFELGNILATEVRIYSSGCINNSRSISIREITCTGAASDVFTK